MTHTRRCHLTRQRRHPPLLTGQVPCSLGRSPRPTSQGHRCHGDTRVPGHVCGIGLEPRHRAYATPPCWKQPRGPRRQQSQAQETIQRAPPSVRAHHQLGANERSPGFSSLRRSAKGSRATGAPRAPWLHRRAPPAPPWRERQRALGQDKLPGKNKYKMAASAGNQIIAMPLEADRILRIDAESEDVHLVDGPRLTGKRKYGRSAVANGKVYGIPCEMQRVLEYACGPKATAAPPR